MLIVGEDEQEIKSFKEAIASKWQITDKGPIKTYLGVEIAKMQSDST